jgi:hypothetical protein
MIRSKLGGVCIAILVAVRATPAGAVDVAQTVHAAEFNGTGGTVGESGPFLSAGDPIDARVEIGRAPHKNVFNQPTFAEAFSAFSSGGPSFWISMNANNSRAPDFRGNGRADVHIAFRAVKQQNEKAVILHGSGGLLQLIDSGGPTPLFARVDLKARVSTDEVTLPEFDAFAQLTGNGGAPFATTFDFKSSLLGVNAADFIEQRAGTNITGATLQIPAFDIPIDISGIHDDVSYTMSIFLFGEVRAPGGETAARAFYRDPAFVNDVDPFAGATTLTFETVGPGTVPEPSTWAMMLIGFAGLGYAAFRRSSRTSVSALA